MKWAHRPSCQVLVSGHDAIVPDRLSDRLASLEEPPSPSEQLAARLLSRAIRTFPEPHFNGPLRRASRQALLLAEQTGYALLVLPELFAELAILQMLQAEYRRLGRL
jgi:hypothetical protein